MKMSRKERRLAARLGVEWVGLRPGGWIEVCLGGPGCGCGEEDGPQARLRGEDRPQSRTSPEPPGEPLPSAGSGTVVGSSGRWSGRYGALGPVLRLW